MPDTPPPNDQQEIARRANLVTMIPLAEAVLPDPATLAKHYADTWPSEHPLSDIKVEDETLLFQVGDGFCAVALMRAAIPWHELEGPCHTAWYWPEAVTTLEPHMAHLLVTLSGGSHDPVERVILLTRLAASVAAITHGALGVYWCHATLVHDAPVFVDMARQMRRDHLPLCLWIDFRINQSGEDRFTLFTTGLVALGFMEIEMVDLVADPQRMVGSAYNIAHYLIDSGPVLQDEDSIGLSETETLIVHHQPSHLDPRMTVYRLAYG